MLSLAKGASSVESTGELSWDGSLAQLDRDDDDKEDDDGSNYFLRLSPSVEFGGNHLEKRVRAARLSP